MMRQETNFDFDGSGSVETVAAIGDLSGNSPLIDTLGFLDCMLGEIRPGRDVSKSLHAISFALNTARNSLAPEDWAHLCEKVRAHPLIDALREDPFTARVAAKPRGYAGDAVMIDLIYGTGDAQAIVANASSLGQAIFADTSRSQSSDAVRERRSILADLVEQAVDSVRAPTVLALAAGHLREAGLSKAYANQQIGRWVALDQDIESCAEIERTLRTPVEAVPLPVSAIIRGEYAIDGVDLGYAAGLYDYLPTAIAIKLTRRMAAMLRPGGRYVFANFATGIVDAGYMEAVMEWPLILRSTAEMRAIATAAGPEVTQRHWTGIHDAIHYCELARP